MAVQVATHKYTPLYPDTECAYPYLGMRTLTPHAHTYA